MLHNALIRKRTDALTRRDDRWNWKSRNFGIRGNRAAAFRQTWRATCWIWLTTLFACKFRLPLFSIGTVLSFFWTTTVQRRWSTGSFLHHGCIDSERGEVKMCFGMKKVVNWEPRWSRTRTPVHLPQTWCQSNTRSTYSRHTEVIFRESFFLTPRNSLLKYSNSYLYKINSNNFGGTWIFSSQ